MSLLPNKDYQNILNSLKEKIRLARHRSALKVNYELLNVYWEIGATILQQQNQAGWGAKIIDSLAIDLKIEFPEFKGLSVRNLKYMRAFAEAYPDFAVFQLPPAQLSMPEKTINEIVQVPLAQLENNTGNSFVQGPLAQISWYHHITLLDKVKDPGTRFFYMQKVIENGWTRNDMVIHIDNRLHERQGKAITNFSTTLPSGYSEFAATTLKSPYIIDFLSITEEMKERDIEKGLIQHLKKFMLELGRGFAYVGNQKNLVVDGDDFFLDLLFFNYILNCFVVIELKVGDFKPEFAGKLNFYINTINEQLKTEHHKPTIGVLLCKTPNKTVVEFSLKGINTPIGVADYELAKALPKELRGEIPSVAELEAEIEKEYKELRTPAEKRFDALKEKVAKLKGEETKEAATVPILLKIIDKSVLPLYEALLNRIARYVQLFLTYEFKWQGKDGSFSEFSQLGKQWKNEDYLKSNVEFFSSCRFHGFKKAGTEAFDAGFELRFRRDPYWYGFIIVNYNNHHPIIKKMYHLQLTTADIDFIVETVDNFILDDINSRLERISK